MLKWYQEPFLHFIILGAILFFIIDIGSSQKVEDKGRVLHVKQEDVSSVLNFWNRDHNRTPSKEELDTLLKDYNQHEILYREALRKNLDKDDSAIKKILVDKLKYSMSDSLNINEVSLDVLEEYYNENRNKFFQESQLNLTFGHIYLNPQEHADVDVLAKELLKEIKDSPYELNISKKGDKFYAGNYFNNLTEVKLSKFFSRSFIRELVKLPKDKWSIIKSGFGVHLIYIVDIKRREIKFDDIKDKVKDTYIIEKNRDAYKIFFKEIKDKYKIIIDDKNETGTF